MHILVQVGDEGLRRYNSWTMSEEDKIDPKKIFAAFEEQLEPPENYRISRLKLTQYRQTREESLDDVTNRWKLQALKCDFVDDELNERLIELIISSTPIGDFKKELLNKPKGMKLHESVALGRSYEASATHVKQIQQLQQMNAVQIDQSHPYGMQYSPAKNYICHACQRHGHWAKCCFPTIDDEHRTNSPARGRHSTQPTQRSFARGQRRTGRVFFLGARIWLRMTFNYPVLWVRVKGQG